MIVEAWHLVALFVFGLVALAAVLIGWGILDRWDRDGWDG